MSVPRKDSARVYNVVAAKFIGLKSIVDGKREINKYTGNEINYPKEVQMHEVIEHMNFDLHVGYWGGMFGKIFTFIVGIICTSLPVTGFLIWWGEETNHQKRQKKLKIFINIEKNIMNNWFKFLCFSCFWFLHQRRMRRKVTVGEKQTLFSKILNENREIWVHLPKTYNDSSINPAKYPVIYLLDGEINFEYYAGMTDFLSKAPYADIPECIVVGIKNTERTRDLTPTKSQKKVP
jgi:hypothetical protein